MGESNAVTRPEFTDVPLPDEPARAEARRRHATLIKPVASLGRLEELGAWIAACQGVCPPRPFARPRVVIFAGDHGVAAKGVSAYPVETTAQLVNALLKGQGVPNALASVAGAGVRVLDLAVDAGTSAEEFKVRRGSGSIDHEDALTEAEVEAALRAGVEIANSEIDSGADLLVAGDLGVGVTTPASVLVAALTGTEPVAVVGRGSGIDDNTWMRKTAAIRDALRRARAVLADPVALLRASAGADLAAMAGFLAQAAVRRTPVLLDGLPSAAAALVADELAPNARSWWVASHRSAEPAHDLALDHLDLVPVVDLGIRLGEGAGALTALPILMMSARLLTDVASYVDAGVHPPA
ncbi:nicotinate-nucleotide--dimethylbenzimidazole phosphoribosyltransferase [Amycolatopsis alkalitolerans]|uniref:Nicotinate-nucleotide--dimethylbenzimidazole phosphoribosyltransferase n=1 Tax=Amycolatopsis alkalitolerans TaxID=2547244 RepID=A0A5C4LYN7_9PSEU|nr:nicotinate-nucleotide--dimethylbenzimidazole phosphoribosyltransferase [Amycolatopsis alkalitolerans]TNC23879.1 nicotinate-nucleotide--dimethylbenzimidazole phosphoribosyltransferase [Amycolatopsis alkalitolerans]